MKKTHQYQDTASYAAILSTELTEIGRQETRTDNKATHIITLSGILLTLSIASMGFMSTKLTSIQSLWFLLPGLALLASTVFWISTIIELLRHVVRPSLRSDAESSFLNSDRYEYFKTAPLEEYQLDKIKFLNELLVHRYVSLRRAVGLLLMGFVCVIAALLGAVLLALPLLLA